MGVVVRISESFLDPPLKQGFSVQGSQQQYKTLEEKSINYEKQD